jgi:hypothetical protein
MVAMTMLSVFATLATMSAAMAVTMPLIARLHWLDELGHGRRKHQLGNVNLKQPVFFKSEVGHLLDHERLVLLELGHELVKRHLVLSDGEGRDDEVLRVHWLVGEDGLGLSAENNQRSGMADVVSKRAPLLLVPGVDGALDVVEDLNSIDNEVLANVPDEGNGVGEDLDDVLEHLDVVLQVLAVGDGRLRLFRQLSEVLDALQLAVERGCLAVVERLRCGWDDRLDILDALAESVEAFGLHGALEEALNEQECILSVQFDWVLHDGNLLGRDQGGGCEVTLHLK